MGEEHIGLYLAGRISAEVALGRLMLAGASPDEITAWLARSETPRGQALLHAVASRAEDLWRLRDVFATVNHAWSGSLGEDGVTRIRDAFDRAVAASPEASVASYSLGDGAILAAATEELVAWLDDARLIVPDADVLDLGCGIGRVAAALATRVRSVLGVDVSPAMIDEARRRCPASNLRFETTPGTNLATLVAAGFDLVLAVDSFPYLMQAGPALAERHIADAARILRSGGSLVILNLSYRNDHRADAADAARWATAYGFVPVTLGELPFALWDGCAFVLRRT